MSLLLIVYNLFKTFERTFIFHYDKIKASKRQPVSERNIACKKRAKISKKFVKKQFD
jgi:hypothetical protein